MDIRSFAEEIKLSNPILSQVRPDLERVRKGLWKRIPLNEPFPEPTTASLISLLPSRAVVDELVGLYLTYIESTHRIFHAPTFLRDLDKFWGLTDTPNMASPSFAAQLLLMLSCAWHLADPVSLQEKNGEELKCYTAVEWVLHAEKWIENLHVKRPEINSMRISILLIKARNWYGMKRSQAWLATGTLVREAMMAGYHRDPSRYMRISPFNKEMRRRIWTTIVELDLQVAFDRGMPPSVQSSDYDVFSALNVNDNEFNEDVTDLPLGRPLSEVTDASFHCVLLRSLPLRLKACHLMHSPRISCRYEEIQHLDWELTRHIARIPAWTALEGIGAVTQHKVSLWKALIETKLAQTLLSIHTPFALEAGREALFVPSARSRMDVASKILSTQRELHETSRPLSLCLLGEWTLQAYMSICQILHSGESRNGMFPLHCLLNGILRNSSYLQPTIHHVFDAQSSRPPRIAYISGGNGPGLPGRPISAGCQRSQGLFLSVDNCGVSQSQTMAYPSSHVQTAGGRTDSVICADIIFSPCQLRASGHSRDGQFQNQPGLSLCNRKRLGEI